MPFDQINAMVYEVTQFLWGLCREASSMFQILG